MSKTQNDFVSDLTYKTRGDASPQGKPRVYFCCHPKDFELFFEPIAKQLLDLQNCALWFPHDPFSDAHADERLEDLREMQLFVVPVTSHLLFSPNRAMDVEIPFALESHIPVLPLMQESGLLETFNKRFGDIQYLDPNERDITAIPYGEKLKNYLSAVLVGDELAEKIRDAFDAYVFLSYRKKDRRHAQELMRLIHKNDFCRDIAIWYDEFLVPGEGFNEAIQAALEKSGLFTLVVTPNLVNGKNYVMTKEFPLARDSKKPILPAEMVKTDRDELAQKYKGIPATVDGHDENALSQNLLALVSSIAKKENDNDPQHNFFIGMAYQNGIDVEVDHARAVSLITFAAENGLVEAVDQLVTMYREAIGVERDYREAIRWQEHKIKLLSKVYDKEPNEGNQNKLFWAIIKCGDYQEELADLSAALAQYQKAQTLCMEYPKKDERNVKRNLSVSQDRAGKILQAQGKPNKAKILFEQALNIAKMLVEQSPTIQTQRDLSISYVMLGELLLKDGDLNGAEYLFEQALNIQKALVEQSSTIEARRDLSVSYNLLGELLLKNGDPNGAKTLFEQGLDIRKALVEQSPTIEARRDLSVSYGTLGDLLLKNDNFDGAESLFEQALNIQKALVEQSPTIESRRDLSVSYEKLGELLLKKSDPNGAKTLFKQSLDIAKALVKQSPTIQAQRDLSVSYEKLGNLLLKNGDLDGAKTLFEQSLDIAKTLVKQSPTIEAYDDLAVSYYKCSFVYQQKKERLKNLQRAYDIYEQLHRKYPSYPLFAQRLDIVKSAIDQLTQQ